MGGGFLKKRLRFAVFFLALMLLFQGMSAPMARGEGPPERHEISWPFLVYAAPDFRAEIRGSFDPQTVTVIQRRDDGWALVHTYNGSWWTYLREHLRHVHEATPLYDRPGGTQIATLPPQTVRVFQQDGNWLQISTWLGPRWIEWQIPGEAPPKQPTPGEVVITWQFITYLEPDFRAVKQESFVPQTVNVLEQRDDGWARITTTRGDRWVYLRANMRYIERGVALRDGMGGRAVGWIEPQVVTVLQQDRNWFQISTWMGPQWIHLVPPRQPGERRIAMTFDDGPSIHTRRLLDALVTRDVPVTFFVQGQQVAAFPDLANRIVAEGHEIACHTFRHPNLALMGAAGVRSELQQTRDIIQQTTGVTPAVFRPPYGLYTGTVRTVAAEFGYPIILWSVDTRDWESRNVNTILTHFASGRIQDGDIILLHDIHSTTIDASIRAIDLLLAEGFTFVTVSELLAERYGTPAPGGIYTSAR